MEAISLKQVTIADVAQLQYIARQTFFQAFASVNKEEDMNRYMAESFSAEGLSNEISNPCSEFYFAMAGNEVIGYLKLNTGQAQTELKKAGGLEIQRIYVLQAYHGKGVGQLFYDKALQVAKQKNAGFIWLGVWEKNAKAIRFYKKNGFVEFDKHVFMLGDDEQTDLMMKLPLLATDSLSEGIAANSKS